MKIRDDKEFVNEGDRYFDAGDLERAESCYLKAIELNPDQFNAYYSLGALYYDKCEYYSSLTFSEKAKELDPYNHFVRFNMGLALNMLNDDEEAANEFKRAVELKPDYATGHFALANTLKSIERNEEAQYHYSLSVKHKVKYDNVWYLWGKTLFSLGEYKLAKLCFETFYTVLDQADNVSPNLSEEIVYKHLFLIMGKTEFFLGNDFSAKKYFYMIIEEEEDLAFNHAEVYLYLLIMEKRSGSDISAEEYRYKILESSADPYSLFSYDLYSCPRTPFFFLKKIIKEDVKSDKFWSDMYPAEGDAAKEQILIYCNICKCYHHIDELSYITGLPAVDYPEDLSFIELVDSFDVSEFVDALKQSWPVETEKKIREHFLWRLNHPFRFKDKYKKDSSIRKSNLNSLYDIMHSDKDSLFYAEICRESGRFDECIETIRSLLENSSFEDKEYAFMILQKAEDKDLEPFMMFEKEEEEIFDFDLEDFDSEGFIVFPEPEDVFAFCDFAKVRKFKPFLSVDLSKNGSGLKGWATFTCRTEALLHIHDRLFTEEEYKYFSGLEKSFREDLVWFWSYKSWDLPVIKEDLERYYKIRSQLIFRADYLVMGYPSYEEYDDFISDWKKDEQKSWEEMEKDLKLNSEEKKWYQVYKDKFLWDSIQRVLESGETISDKNDLKQLISDDLKTYKKREKERKNAEGGLKYFQSYPSWFQGDDMTPFNSNGEEYIFIGQIWSDYLDVCGSKLIYLFYDPLDKRQVEEYDYD